MNLLTLAQSYLAARLGLSRKHADDVLSVCRRCWLATGGNGQLPAQADLLKWLQSQWDRGVSRATIAHHLRILRAVLRWGATKGLCPPIDLPKLTSSPRVPEAWTVEEFSRLLQAAARTPGRIGQWPAKDWWPALLLTLYWTGARLSAVLSAQPSDLDWQSKVLWLRHTKNGRPKPYLLPQQAIEAIRRVFDPDAPRLLLWPRHHSKFWAAYRAIVEAAGLPYVPYRSGTHKIRRTCLTYCWIVDPAIAQRQADHANAEVTKRHYIDPRIALEAKTAAHVLPVPDYQPGPVQLLLFD